jgi:hypothetical protein
MNNKKAPLSFIKDDDAMRVSRGATLILSIPQQGVKLTVAW